jgi:hypothetical protein
MWNPDEALRTARPVTLIAIDEADRRLRAQVWGAMVGANVLLWVVGLCLIGRSVI